MEELEILSQIKSLELLRKIKFSIENRSDLTEEEIKATILQKIKNFDERQETNTVAYQIETFEPKIIDKTFKQIMPIKLSHNNFKYGKTMVNEKPNFVARTISVKNRLNSLAPKQSSAKILSCKRAA